MLMLDRQFENKNILITGISGFGGSWLAETILKKERKAKIFGLKRTTSSTQNINHIIKHLALFNADLTDYNAIFQAIKKINPQIVFHLGAISSSVKADNNMESAMKTNIDGTKNLLDALVENKTDLEIFHFASSSSIYKKTEKSISINESCSIDGHDVYSMSKIEAEKICMKISKRNNISVIITRAFNQGGPRCREDIVANKIAKIAASAKKDGIREFAFGNINSVRDFTDVRDITLGYLLAARKGHVNETYNLCSSKGIKIADMINMSLDYVGLKDKVKIITDEKLFRKGEADVVVGDNTKAQKELGWKPKIPFRTNIKRDD